MCYSATTWQSILHVITLTASGGFIAHLFTLQVKIASDFEKKSPVIEIDARLCPEGVLMGINTSAMGLLWIKHGIKTLR